MLSLCDYKSESNWNTNRMSPPNTKEIHIREHVEVHMRGSQPFSSEHSYLFTYFKYKNYSNYIMLVIKIDYQYKENIGSFNKFQ